MFDYTAFSHGQIESKIWLCTELEKFIPTRAKIALLGGWYGIISLLLFSRCQSSIDYIRSYDLDPNVESIADKINNAWVYDKWKFKAITADANSLDLSEFDVVINTSSEHIIDRSWFDKLTTQLIVIQGTDQIHDDNDPHDYVFDLGQLKSNYPMLNFYEGQREFVYPDKTFNRYMLIGRKF